jgi:nucleoside-triphosphatase
MTRVILTGQPGCGKTTLCKKIVKELKVKGLKIGGMISSEIREAGVRKGFKIVDLATGEEGILAHIDQKEGPKVGKYRVCLDDLERIGVKAIESALEEADVIVVDEIAKMENSSPKFRETIQRVLRSKKPILLCVHRTLAKDFEGVGEVFWVQKEKFEELKRSAVDKLSPP